MDNQHKKIKGYRDLSQAEIDLMNEIKAKGAEFLLLQERIECHLFRCHGDLERAAGPTSVERAGPHAEAVELRRFERAEPQRWCAIGRTDIQTGIMALVRAVAQPEGI